MATILMTWELGSGIGHLMRLRPVGEMLVQRGHRVVVAARNLSEVRHVLEGTGIAYLGAPHIPVTKRVYAPMRSYAHILANVGLVNEDIAATLFAAWNTLFDSVRPDLVILDHSPTALLALQERPIPVANMGLGFFCPPVVKPLPMWLTAKEQGLAPSIAADEQAITDRVNRVLQLFHRAPLPSLGHLYQRIDETFLATYEEFDHFGPRPGSRYWGHWPFFPGDVPQWPAGSGAKIFGYLKPFAGVERLLEWLVKSGHPSILLGIHPKWQHQFTAPHIHYAPRPLDLRAVASECDLAVLNAGHGTTVTMLLAGKPCLLVPLFTEQLLFAQTVQKLGAGQSLPSDRAGEFETTLGKMLAEAYYAANARKIASKYTAFAPGEQLPGMVNHLEQLIQINRF